MKIALLLSILGVLSMCAFAYAAQIRGHRTEKASMAKNTEATETAIFAGGCFWCMHAAFESLPGVISVRSGYTGGTIANPTYEQVSAGTTGHVEAIEVVYNPAQVAYTKLLEWFWDNVDPTDASGQFCDKGSQYLAGIFYSTPDQQQQAQKSLVATEKKLGQKVATFIRPASVFYVAEDYHQGFHRKNPGRYQAYKQGCGRDQRLDKLWQRD